MNDSELWRRFMALRAESEALAPPLRLPAPRPGSTVPRSLRRRLAAAALAAAALVALALLSSASRMPDGPRAGPTPSPVTGRWTTPSDALLAPVAFDLARSLPDFSAPHRAPPRSPRSTP
jgi:hypothetical protein